jgi:tripartite-type tricarboxylate transporter receptor subunit TctC
MSTKSGFRSVATALTTALLGLAAGIAAAQEFPSKPLRIISPASAGTVTDTSARLYANQLNSRLGWTVLVENRAGGDFFPATLALTQSPADGHTLYQMPAGLTILPATRKDLPWDLQRDIQPIARVLNIPLLVAAHPSVPGNTLMEFVAHAKANPGKLSYGAVGLASPTTLAFEFLKQTYGLDIVLVPYKDGAVMTPDLIAGRIQLSVNLVGAFVPHIKDNKVKAVTLFGGRRMPALPNLPTATEATGNADMEITSWTGFTIRAGAPKAVADRLEREILAVSRVPEVRERLAQLDYEPLSEDAATFAKRIESDLKKFDKLIRDAKLDLK